ncbi:M23 family metallopeptidase [Sorangium sp. So ce136]|uniref:M23 family metallopeptidase n=1 Tax=Sorangium sp. So ce136 TaxID=3133284 RepID=UPI003EFC4681
MQHRTQLVSSISFLSLAAILSPGACAVHGSEANEDTLVVSESTAEAASGLITVSGYGHYCSQTGSGSTWGFAWDPLGNDPCDWMNQQSGTVGTIRRAGIYHTTQTNMVVARCTDNTVWQYRGEGSGPLQAAYDATKTRPGCIFTVSPQRLPIFNKPFTATPSAVNGFDFARGYTLNVADFGQSGPANAQTVNFEGDDRSWADGHDAYDWVLPEGTEVYAVAEGTVVANRSIDTLCDDIGSSCVNCLGSPTPFQGEVYIRHTVSRTPSKYNETFIASYFHIKNRAALSVGQTVQAGTKLGEVSWMGCSSTSHLHFAVVRETNVASARFANFTVPLDQPNNGWHWTIDPYGFMAPQNIDPWGWRGFPDGALSTRLWKSGEAPALGSWGP